MIPRFIRSFAVRVRTKLKPPSDIENLIHTARVDARTAVGNRDPWQVLSDLQDTVEVLASALEAAYVRRDVNISDERVNYIKRNNHESR